MARFADITVEMIDESKRLLDAIDRKERRVLVRTGSFGRGVIRRSIRRRKKVSPVGSAPHAHAPGSSGLKAVLYAVAQNGQSVVIGHQVFRLDPDPRLPFPRG